MSQWRSWLVVGSLVVAAGVAACEEDTGSGGGGPGGSSGGPTGDAGGDADAAGPGTLPPAGAASAFCDKTLGVIARALEACCSPADKATTDYRFTHGIVVSVQPRCTSSLEASITRGRVAYHADQANSCYAAYAATYSPGKCANITQTFSDPAGTACREAFSGLVAAGGACAGDQECSDGLTCVEYTKTTDGSCRAPGAIGQPCGALRVDGGGGGGTSLEFGSHPACAPGARCDSVSGKCVAADVSGAACVGDEECATPLRCHLGVCGTAGPAPAGGACRAKDDCAPGLYCENPSGANGTCAAKKAAGGTCTATSFTSECIGRCDGPSNGPGSCASFCGSP